MMSRVTGGQLIVRLLSLESKVSRGRLELNRDDSTDRLGAKQGQTTIFSLDAVKVGNRCANET